MLVERSGVSKEDEASRTNVAFISASCQLFSPWLYEHVHGCMNMSMAV
jgi:hypothetical protein